MKYKLLSISIVSALLLTYFTELGVAQIDTQTPGYLSTGTASAGTNRELTDVPAVTNSPPDLRVVPEDFAQLRLAPGFLLSLSVLDDSDLSGSFRIDQQGDIYLPTLGSIHVGGKTVSEVRAQIQKSLLDGQILKDPQVHLQVLEYTAPQITIIGEVASPGRYPLLAPRKLVDVLALAGGTTITAGDEIQITRGNASAKPVLVHYSKTTSPKAVEDVVVDPGDTVLIRRAGIVYVLGAVTRPGGYVMQENGTLTLLQAISLANGTTLPASVRKIYVLRRKSDGTEVDISAPYSRIAHGKSADLVLHATDVVYVPTSKIKSIFINGASLMAATASATIYAAVIY